MTEEDIAKRIAGELILSDKPWVIVKKWREIFEASQVEVANVMQVTPSVISDYEMGRRIPGSKFIKKFVNALLEIDKRRGCKKIKEFSNMLLDIPRDAIIDIREYVEPVTVNDICLSVKGELVACSHLSNRKIFGHTIVDSIRCIEKLSGIDFFRLMGETSMRALIFTKVSIGRSPMVAVRVYPIKPAMVVMHGTQHIDELAIKLATIEQIPLVLSKIESVEKMVENLKRFSCKTND